MSSDHAPCLWLNVTFLASYLLNSDNVVHQPAVHGGGVYLSHTSTLLARNVVFSANTANSDGGALFLYASSAAHLTDVQLLHNVAGDDGGGMSCSHSAATFA